MFICFNILEEVLLFLGILAMILWLLSSDSAIEGKEGIQRTVSLSTFIAIFSLYKTDSTDTALVPNVKAERHPQGLD